MTLDVGRKDYTSRAEYGKTVGARKRDLKEKRGFSRSFSSGGLDTVADLLTVASTI